MSVEEGPARWSERPAREPVVAPWPLTTTGTTEVSRRLTRTWPVRWPGWSPVGHELRSRGADRWVRFHSLPGSKRCPRTEAQYAELLRRHRAVLEDLLAQGSSSPELTLIVGAWPDDDHLARGRAPEHGLVPAEQWGSVLVDTDADGWESRLDLFVAQVTLDGPVLDTVLRLVADEALHEVIITDPEVSWLYHPYDSGADVIASSPSRRDRLVAAHPDWLSGHPSGL